MMPQAGLSSSTNIKLPLSFIIYGLMTFIVAQMTLFIRHDALTEGFFRTPDIWMGVHFLLLGFAVMIAMGAMYQLIPVALLTSIWSESFGFIQLGVTIIGITGFAVLLGVSPGHAIYGGIIAILGILMFIFQMTKTILHQKTKNWLTYFILGSILCLFLTITAGFFLAFNLRYGSIANHETILYTHILLGISGWFTLLIFGISYKLVPMFSLAHGYSEKLTKYVFFTYIAGIVLFMIGMWTYYHVLQVIGLFFLFLGFLLFRLHIREMLKNRMKRKLDIPFSFALLATNIGLGVHLVAFICSVFHIVDTTIWGWIIFIYVMGWIIFSILGYLYKIVPFLWWTHSYSDKIGTEKVPTLQQMINENMAIVLYIAFIIGSIGLVCGALLQIGLLVILFQGILVLATILYTATIIRVLLV